MPITRLVTGIVIQFGIAAVGYDEVKVSAPFLKDINDGRYRHTISAEHVRFLVVIFHAHYGQSPTEACVAVSVARVVEHHDVAVVA